jgi:NAD(P)-dependent dehydrogenase (short-subunit alcohol dehydrogenase family)
MALPPPPSVVVVTPTEEEEQKIAIVTGCNTGIGYETAKTLVTVYGYTVIMACRDEAKARIAAAQIDNQKNAIFLVPLDLSSFQSVIDFCKAVQEYGNSQTKKKKKMIHLLVNNAGRNTSGISMDGLDLQFQTNFLGHFLLTKLLMEQEMLTDNARIVNLASVLHHFCGPTKNIETVEFWKTTAAARQALPTVFGIPVDPMGASLSLPSSSTGNNTYPLSKLAAILFTNELNRRYPAPLVTSIAVNPGAV